MNILYKSGSPRKKSNTDYLLSSMLNQTGGEFVKLTNYTILPCGSCWSCLKNGDCAINDDMSTTIIPRLVLADVLVLGTPVYFNNVTARLKSFIDRTWSMRGKLRNKIGAAVVVGRKYGAESVITAVHAFFLKHEMIVANRGISGVAFQPEGVKDDLEAAQDATKLASRILELTTKFNVSRRGGA